MSTQVTITAVHTGPEAEPFRRLLPKAQREAATALSVTCTSAENPAWNKDVAVDVYVLYRGHRPDGTEHDRRSSVRYLLDNEGWLPYCFPDWRVRDVVKDLPGLQKKRERSTERQRMLGIAVT